MEEETLRRVLKEELAPIKKDASEIKEMLTRIEVNNANRHIDIMEGIRKLN